MVCGDQRQMRVVPTVGSVWVQAISLERLVLFSNVIHALEGLDPPA